MPNETATNTAGQTGATTTTPPAAQPPTAGAAAAQGTQPPAPGAKPAETLAPDVAAASKQAAEKLKLLRDRQALDTERTQFAEAQKKHTALVEAIGSKDPVKVLRAAGLTPEEVAKFMLNGAGTTADPKHLALEEKLTAQAKAVEELQNANKAAAEQARKQAEQAARAETIAQIAEAKEALPWVNALEQGDAVIAEMQAEFKKTGVMPELEATAKVVEARIAAQMPTYIEKLVSFPAVKTLLEAALAKVGKPAEGAAAQQQATTQQKPEEKKAQPAESGGWAVKRRTLSNDLNGAGGGPQKPKTEAQLWAELEARFKAGQG
jgi:hypothetical protein